MSASPPVPHLAVDTCARRLRHLDLPLPRPGADPSITWFGPADFAPDRPGSEASVQALAGIMEVNGRDQQAPRRLGLEAASVAAGLLAAQGRLAAAIGDLRGHPGAPATTSVLQAGLLLLSHYFVVATSLGDAVPGPPLPAPGSPFRSGDGHWFEIETLDAEPWQAFWTALGAADVDLGRGWTVFRWRYERATCSLPIGLHEAVARRSLAELRRVAIETEVSLTPLRGYVDVLADMGVDAAHPTLRSLGTPPAAAARRFTRASSPGPLAGIRVVEATSRIQGPFAGMLLRMLGADVLRIQPPEGDYGRAALCLHRGKAAERLDLGVAAGRAELVDRIADADVFLHNWRPGKAAEWDLELEDLAPAHPRLVYANTSGWGDRPEAAELVGTDFLVQANAGMGHGLHPDDEAPFPSRMVLCDLFGGLVGAEGVLAGLYRREKTGGAVEVRSSLRAGAMALQAHVLADLADGREKGRRDGRPVWGVLDRPVPTADGTLMVSADDDASFDRLCQLCDVDPAGAPRRATEQRLADRLAEGVAVDWEEPLLGGGIAAGVVCTDLAAVPADPRLSDLFEPVGVGGLVRPRALELRVNPAEPLAPTLQAARQRWGDRPALTFERTTTTYAELGRDIARLAAAYRGLGVEPGDRIVCQLPNSPEHVVAINAAWAVGAIHVGTDNDLTGRELAWLVARTEAAMLVFAPDPAAADPLAPVRVVLAAHPGTRIVLAGSRAPGQTTLADLLAGPDELTDWSPPHGPDDTAHLLLTSGTTGEPKAVMETLPACWAKMQFFVDAFSPGPDDVHLLYLPMAHVFGMRLAMLALLSGGRLVLAERFSPGAALDLVGAEGVTVLPGMPAHFTLLLDALDPDRHRVDSLRWAISAASNLPRPLVDQIYGRLGVRLLYVYGCSENFTVTTTDPDEIRRGSVGRRVFRGPDGTPPDGRVAILAPGTLDTTPLAPGELGEIAFGAARPVRYWRAPDAATDGWYRTGDLGRIDPDGTVYVLGRLKELVNRGGLHVSPSEVETAVRLHPGVADSAVVATPDPVLGEAICACVVPGATGPPNLAELRDFLAPVLARHKLPDELCVVESIPRTRIGKVDRPALTAAVLANGHHLERVRPR